MVSPVWACNAWEFPASTVCHALCSEYVLKSYFFRKIQNAKACG
jgi:hypothetical protein